MESLEAPQDDRADVIRQINPHAAEGELRNVSREVLGRLR